MDWRVNGQKKTIYGCKVCEEKTAEGREGVRLPFVMLSSDCTLVCNRLPS